MKTIIAKLNFPAEFLFRLRFSLINFIWKAKDRADITK